MGHKTPNSNETNYPNGFELASTGVLTTAAAIELQKALAARVRLRRLSIDSIRYLAAADVSFEKNGGRLFGAVLLFTFPELRLIETKLDIRPITYPYIPGLLSFRELPVLVPLLKQLSMKPDVILVDGQGIAHPRRLGIASHLGVILDIATVGCAKSRLTGRYNKLPEVKGEWSDLIDGEEMVGSVVCTRSGVKPLFVSPGHLADFDSSVQLVLRTIGKYRIPEPLRQAHLTANRLRLEFEKREKST